ncbi:hypothetical protein K3495_g1416 [Podosphaera aphanis]|nr:hypothetical protein K3495_g1416 [Podosphaera aphanis]
MHSPKRRRPQINFTKEIANLLLSSDASSNNSVLWQMGLPRDSKTNYEQFVAEVQDLANELETIPPFGTSRGSIQVAQNYDNQPDRTLDAVPKEIFSSPPNFPAAPTPSHNVDGDGDSTMTDISALQGTSKTAELIRVDVRDVVVFPPIVGANASLETFKTILRQKATALIDERA